VTGEFTTELEGRPYTMQYVERRRFELHPELGPNTVLLGLLGREVLTARQGQPQPPPSVPPPGLGDAGCGNDPAPVTPAAATTPAQGLPLTPRCESLPSTTGRRPSPCGT